MILYLFSIERLGLYFNIEATILVATVVLLTFFHSNVLPACYGRNPHQVPNRPNAHPPLLLTRKSIITTRHCVVWTQSG